MEALFQSGVLAASSAGVYRAAIQGGDRGPERATGGEPAQVPADGGRAAARDRQPEEHHQGSGGQAWWVELTLG